MISLLRKNLNILIMAAVLLAVFLPAQLSYAHVVTGYVNLFGQDLTPATFRLYDVSTTSAISSGDAVYAASYTIAYDLSKSDFANFAPAHQPGDTAVIILDRELNSGTVSHAGYYTVDDVILNGPSQVATWENVYAIPHPTAVTTPTGAVNVTWLPAVDDGTNNIIGYKVYRSTTGLVADFTELATVSATSTSTVDVSASMGGTYYYAISILFRGTIATPEVETLYLSTNSNAVTVGTPGVSIISVDPYYGTRGTTLEVTIIGRNTHFNISSEVAFEGLNHITVESVTYDSPTQIRARINISSEAEIGFRNVVVISPVSPTTNEVAVGANMFVVIPVTTLSMVLSPNAGVRGATFGVAVTGNGTNFNQVSSILFFGNNIVTNTLTVNSSASASSNISIGREAALGTRVALMITGSEVALGDFIVNQLRIDDKIVPNYPNPFDPQREVTRIVIDLEEPTEVGIYMYDITARQVWKYSQYLPVGQTQVIWNGYTYYNKIGDNGVYIMKVVDETNKKIIGRGKVLIIKR